MADLVYRAVIVSAKTLFAAQGLRFRIEGTQHVPRVGGAIMVINHVGYLDFAFAGLAALPARRLVRFMAKKEVFDHPTSGPLMRGMRHIPVNRDAGTQALRRAVEVLRAGGVVGVFPEGTISRSFELKEFKAGAVRMAAIAGVPLLPTIVWGSQRVWTKDHPKRLGRSRLPISVYVDEPLYAGRAREAVAAEQVLRERMEALLHKVQREYADQQPKEDDRWWLPARLGGTAPTPAEAARMDAEERLARRSDPAPESNA